MQKNKRTGAVFSGISYILIVLLILAVVGFIVYFTNGLTTDFQSFYLKYGDTVVKQNINGLMLPQNEELRFEVRSSLGKNIDYTVRVESNADEDNSFHYYADGIPQRFVSKQDFTSAFDIVCAEDSFILQWDNNMQNILQTVHPNQTLTEVPDIQLDEKNYFVLIVKAANMELRISFHGYNGHIVQDIELSPGEIIF